MTAGSGIPGTAIDHAAVSRALEEACDFSGAAREAMLAKDPQRAALLAALGGDQALCKSASELIATTLPRDAGLRTAGDLQARGFHGPAGVLFERLGDHAQAATAFAAAGDACASAEAFERAGRPADAARALETRLRAHPSEAAARLALGRLLARHGRTEAAAKTLQQLEPSAPERAQALPLLKRCLADLGLEDAARTLADEMKRLGVSDEAPSSEAAPAPASAAAGTLLFGRYQTIREVAHTPHARVVEATDRVTGEHVAVKLFVALASESGRDALLRFEREARALAQIRHPNVLPLRAYLPEGPAIVVAWMSGGSLAERMAASPTAPGRAVEIAGAVLGALGEAHRLGILHRDVKPSNVLFDDAGTACLADFGAAHLGDLSSTATAGAIGTFAYMSPEQRLGRPASLASDLYGVGVMLGELLTGEAPGPAVHGAISPRPSESHADLTAAHDAIVARFLDEDPSHRPADAFEARRLLQSIAWSSRVLPKPARADKRARVSERPTASEQRLVPAAEPGDGRDTATRKHDAWLGRDVLILAADEHVMERARAFARAGHPSLPSILRADVVAGAVWVAPPRGRSLADEPRGLPEGIVARLREAVRALHEAGGAHGRIDAEHLYFDAGEIALAYPRADVALDEARAADVQALVRLTQI